MCEDGGLYSELATAAGDERLEAVVLRDGEVTPLSSESYSAARAMASGPCTLRCFLRLEGWV